MQTFCEKLGEKLRIPHRERMSMCWEKEIFSEKTARKFNITQLSPTDDFRSKRKVVVSNKQEQIVEKKSLSFRTKVPYEHLND